MISKEVIILVSIIFLLLLIFNHLTGNAVNTKIERSRCYYYVSDPKDPVYLVLYPSTEYEQIQKGLPVDLNVRCTQMYQES